MDHLYFDILSHSLWICVTLSILYRPKPIYYWKKNQTKQNKALRNRTAPATQANVPDFGTRKWYSQLDQLCITSRIILVVVSSKVVGTHWLAAFRLRYLVISEICVWITVLVILSSSFLTDHAMTMLLLMKINSWTCWYCLVHSKSRRKRTHAHCHIRPKRFWTTTNSVCWCASMTISRAWDRTWHSMTVSTRSRIIKLYHSISVNN